MDILASEYGWSMEDIERLTPSQTDRIIAEIRARYERMRKRA